ncbi:MAG: 4'-phosphopantetheinyl transferase [Gammaproteobacteria bacterium]|nr:MAG: 4'-phosphopantetheinyl transferase [Pseudomonadota bacterium]PIE38798.1 MAG: 4'-phosphopantetheinyl transferase [Gammaproteobacteria bacterium]
MIWATDGFTLPASTIHLWFCEEQTIRKPETLALYRTLLSRDEIGQQAKFRFESDQHRFLVTRSLVRSVLSLYYPPVSPKEWQFTKNRYGRPGIANPIPLPLHFNLSHTDKMVLLAVAAEPWIGVDIETTQRRNPGNELKLAERFFSEEEARQLAELPDHGRKERFFQLWTLKEAYVKACGKGLAIPLDRFSFTFPDQVSIDISFAPEHQDNPQDWLFWQIRSSDGFYCSLACRPSTKRTDIDIKMFSAFPLVRIKPVHFPFFRQKSFKRKALKENL